VPAFFLFVLLVAFWAILSGHFHEAFLVGAGVVTTVGVTWISSRLGLVIREWSPGRLLWALVAYLPWLLWEVVLANLKVIRIVWDPRLPVSPRMVEVPCTLKTGLGRAVYANSITLTPGTVSVVVEDDVILVHALTEGDEEGLLDGAMEARVGRLEPPA